MKRTLVGVAVALAVLLGGVNFLACRRSMTVASASGQIAPASRPASGPVSQTYHDAKFGITLTYPSDWKQQPSNDYELMIVPAPGPSGASISLDVPTLPTHFGFIPINMVYDGYLSDLKKKWTDVNAKETAPPVPGAHARLAQVTGKCNGKDVNEQALLLVHSDHVYIIRADSLTADAKSVGDAFDAMTKSLQWK